MPWPNRGLAHRPLAQGQHGAVSSANPLASLAGLRMMLQGGNAIDAAVAVAAALNVVEPYMSGAGGVGYMVITPAGAARPVVLDYIGRAPAAATLDVFQRAGPGSNDTGILSPLVPGALAGWLRALETYGTMDRATVFAPAIEYAEQGIPITLTNVGMWMVGLDTLRQWPTSAATYLHDGQIPAVGSLLKQPELARTFHAVVEGGADAFYRGAIGEELTRFAQEHGGLLTMDDLATYEPSWQEPVSTTYRGYEIICPPPPCSGMQYLQTLNIVEGFDLAAMGQNSAEYIHHLAEAMKLAVADRTTYAPDPHAPLAWLLSKEYARERRALIDPRHAAYSGGERYTAMKLPQEVRPGSPASLRNESTTHFVTADASGNSVSTTQTLGSVFGSAVVHGNTGLLLNNFAHWFDLEPTSPNVIAPRKRVEMCLAPSQVWRDGRLFMLVGTPGSFGIMQTTPQMMLNVFDFEYSMQAAIEAPRFRTMTGYELPIEGRVSAETLDALRQLGHQPEVLAPWTMFVGGGHGIMVDRETGWFAAGADPRRDGYGLAF